LIAPRVDRGKVAEEQLAIDPPGEERTTIGGRNRVDPGLDVGEMVLQQLHRWAQVHECPRIQNLHAAISDTAASSAAD
jgi:hypothetical protein